MANEILPFGLGAESNVMTQAEYEALAARSGGFSSGVAKSEQLNKVWRQSAFVASVLAQFIANRSEQDVLDDGDTANLLTSLELAIKTYANASLPAASTSIAGIAQLSNSTTSTSETLAATPKAVKAVNDAALKIANNLSEIATAGQAAVAAALANLSLSSGLFPIGMPFFWPSTQTPADLFTEMSGQVFLRWNGATFTASQYPKLALVIPSLTLTEARGEFPRIWDAGRGADIGRVLLSIQSDAIRNLTGSVSNIQFKTNNLNTDGVLLAENMPGVTGNVTTGSEPVKIIKFDASMQVPTATENRPRNIAFNFLVRAK
ncbi:putative bacteriophage tail fiber protein [Yersinia enterocolitica]|uniref:tail fiber protein n=1 Tax=Yersinia enterocolitica TaxID=630 RepID=UPI0005DD5405|nr:tail fiber protein [Yersinia enterocolitica]CNG70558.1 putative bacteriophage tail fiber protein [Yersinia enterocolitica]